MNYITKDIELPIFDKSSIHIYFIGDEYERVVTRNSETHQIELDSTYGSEIINGDKFFPNLEGEQIFDPYIYNML